MSQEAQTVAALQADEETRVNVIAIHEAGHAVVATYYGVGVESMTLRADSGTTNLSFDRESRHVRAAVAYAGLAAERRIDLDASFQRGCKSDLRDVAEYTEHWSDETLDAFYASTLALVRMLWPFIVALADALVKWKKLTGKQVSAFLHGLPVKR